MRWEGTHLTYCMNIHPGETWQEVRSGVDHYARAVKERVCPKEPFGLGLRLSALAAAELEPHLDAFKDALAEAGMYVFTLNGFPYGPFHGTSVKERVYRPGWGSTDRASYTRRLGTILATLLPDGVDGSVSTVPVAYGKSTPEGAAANLLAEGRALARLAERTGKKVVLALEPEPDCLLETSADVLRFWDGLRAAGDAEVIEFLGICLDTCHMACAFERPVEALRRVEAAGIPVPKVHVTAALCVLPTADPHVGLAGFADPVYLHQTRVSADGEVRVFPDLPEALRVGPQGEWRVHFHVPLHFAGEGDLASTAFLLDGDFFSKAVTPDRHLEIETYTFDLLPDPKKDVITSIADEFHWIFEAYRKSRAT